MFLHHEKKTISTYANGDECFLSNLLHLFYIRSSWFRILFQCMISGRKKSTSSLQTCQTIVSWRKIKSSDMLLHFVMFFSAALAQIVHCQASYLFGCVVKEKKEKNGMLCVRDSLTFAFINSDALSFIFHSFSSDAVWSVASDKCVLFT